MKDAAKCAETMEEMRRAGVTPDVTSCNMLMNAFKETSQGILCLQLYHQMRSERVAVDSFTLSTLFGGLLSGLNGDRSAGAAKVVELSRDPSVLPCNLLNHDVAATVLRALADVGSISDLDSFWRKCSECLGNTREG